MVCSVPLSSLVGSGADIVVPVLLSMGLFDEASPVTVLMFLLLGEDPDLGCLSTSACRWSPWRSAPATSS